MKQFSEETKRRMREAQGKRWTPEARRAASESRIIPLDKDKVETLYAMGLSMRQVGEHLGVSAQKICDFMLANDMDTRRPGELGHQRGPHHKKWKGDDAGRSALHCRVERLFGKPAKCATCGTTDPCRIYEWANLTGNYSDPLDYKRMCRPCHRAYDKARWKETGRYTSPGSQRKIYGGTR